MSRFYSQSGEDFLLNEIFKDKDKGFFVEVGCIDGRRFSNTLFFEEKGWKGLCVEAHASYIELLKKNRPNSIVCHCAAAEKDEEDITFYANARGSLSTLDKTQEGRWKKEFGQYFTGFQEQKVKKRRLDSLFSENQVKEIDFLSLDIEGYEVEALRGIDFKKYKPAVIVVESDSHEHRKGIEDMLCPAGYHAIGELSDNVFYSVDKGLASRVGNKVFRKIKLTHTQHPLDKDGDKTVVVDIGTGKPMAATAENAALVTPYKITAAARFKAVFEKRRYPGADFRHYQSLWNAINGWLTFKQAEWLFEEAKKKEPAGEIVEIGSAYGRSTVALGAGLTFSSNGRIHSVDPHIGGKGFREQLKERDSYTSLDGFKDNLKRFNMENLVVPIVKTSEEGVKEWKEKGIRLLFIDGWHTYEAVTHDILGWHRYVVPGGVIAMHDYQDEDVRRAIHDCMGKLGINESKLKHVDAEMVYFKKT